MIYSKQETWASIYNLPTAIFWSAILGEVEEIPILVQKLIETILVLPIGNII